MFTLRVMAGSPENKSLVFEIARFTAGSMNLPTLRMSSSFSLISVLVSAFSLKVTANFSKKKKKKKKGIEKSKM